LQAFGASWFPFEETRAMVCLRRFATSPELRRNALPEPASPRRATPRGVVLTFRVSSRTVAVALVWRLRLRPFKMDLDVFPPATAPALYEPGCFLSWPFTLPQGSACHAPPFTEWPTLAVRIPDILP
jgi:hypothetical protein